MAESAKQRLQAIGQQLAPTTGGVPSIKQVAAPSTSPRAQGKVVIITGEWSSSLFPNYMLTMNTLQPKAQTPPWA